MENHFRSIQDAGSGPDLLLQVVYRFNFRVRAYERQFEDTNRSWSSRWVLGVVAAAAVAWLFFGPTKVVEPTKKTPGQVSVDSVNLKSSLESALSGLKANLRKVSDAASAKAALPQLEKGAAEFDKLRKLSVNLPADSKGALAARLASARPTLDGLFDKLLAIPGVDSIARPTIDALRAKLDALNKALQS